MAYLKKKSGKTEKEDTWTGPFASRKGEWLINHFNEYPIKQENVSVGKPKACPGLPSDKLERMNFSGLYLTKDIPIPGNPSLVMEIDTDLLHEEVVSGQQLATKGINPKFVMEKQQA